MNKNDYIMDICKVVASKSTCKRKNVGAVFINSDYEILATGYNGVPKGFPHCIEVGCTLINEHCVASVHAEQNAIIQATRRGTSLKNSILFITLHPCFNCIKLLITLGVKKNSIFRRIYT